MKKGLGRDMAFACRSIRFSSNLRWPFLVVVLEIPCPNITAETSP